MAPKRKRARFESQAQVIREMASELDVDPDDLVIEVAKGYETFLDSDARVWELSLGRKEWFVVKDRDVARELAIAIVKQDLEQEPEIFNKYFLESLIDTDNLRDELMGDVVNHRRDDADEMDSDDFWRAAKQLDMDVPDEDEDGNYPEPTLGDKDDYAEKAAEEELRDPMAYLEDIYGAEAAAKEAIEIVGIDVDKGAEEAVNVDGAGHFLSGYDGETHETASGFVYWRHN